VVEHHRGGEDERARVGDVLPGDVGRGAVHRLEDRRVDADVRPRREPEPADEPRDQVAEDVAEQVRGDDHVELLGRDHELHRHRVDDLRLELDAPLVLARHLAPHVEEEPLRELEDVRLVDQRDLPPPVRHRVLEGVADDALRAEAGDERHRLAPRAGRRRS
jgi:hypothetical protein